MIDHAEMLQLKRWNTPTIYNGWEQISARDTAHECFNLEPPTDYMPQMGVMVGRAVTVVIEPGEIRHKKANPNAFREYWEYLAAQEGPKIVVVQDLEKGRFGSFWGEVNANLHRGLGCVGAIVDGSIRDVDEMTNAGFKALARRLCIGHAHACPVKWNVEVSVFGCPVKPGQLIHADKHGFIAVPAEDEDRLLEASQLMDRNECLHVIRAARSGSGQSSQDYVKALSQAAQDFGAYCDAHFAHTGEW